MRQGWAVAKFLVHDWDDIVDSGIGGRAGRRDNPRSESTLSPQSGTKNLASDCTIRELTLGERQMQSAGHVVYVLWLQRVSGLWWLLCTGHIGTRFLSHKYTITPPPQYHSPISASISWQVQTQSKTVRYTVLLNCDFSNPDSESRISNARSRVKKTRDPGSGT